MEAHREHQTDSGSRISLVRVPAGGEGCQQTKRLSALASGYDGGSHGLSHSPGGSRLSSHGVNIELLVVDG